MICSYCRGTGWVGDGTRYMPRERCHLWPKCTRPAKEPKSTPQVKKASCVECAEHEKHHESLMTHGVMTEEMRALAEVLGLKEGRHTAASVARIARDQIEWLRKQLQPKSFPVTDPEHDAPDGAIVGGYERVGNTWHLKEPKG